MIKKFLLVFTTFFGLMVLTQPTLALEDGDISISVYPATQTIELEPGHETTGTISVMNSGRLPFAFNLSVAPYQVNSETYEPNFSTSNVYTKLAEWVSFAQDSYTLEPDTAVEIEFKISVPEDAMGGGQYAAIMITSNDSANASSPLQLTSQVAAILNGRVSGEAMKPEGEIVEQKIPFFIMDKPLQISETTYNTGNVDFQVYHAMTITNFFTGEEVITPTTKNFEGIIVGSESTMVLPGTSRSHTLTWDGAPKLGIFRVKQTIMFLDEEISDEQLVIFCPLWLILGIVGLIILLIIWIILAAKRHKRKQPQVF